MSFKVLHGSKFEVDLDLASSPQNLREVHVDEPGAVSADHNGNLYRFAQFTDIDVEDGHVLELASISIDEEGSISEFKVSADRDGSSIGRNAVGVAVTSVTGSNDNWGWLLVRGFHPNVITNGSVSAGDYLVTNGSGDGEARPMADGEEERSFGYAIEDDSGSPTVAKAKVNF